MRAHTVVVATMLLWLSPAVALANGPVIQKIDVDVEIDGRVATTRVLHILRNDLERRDDAFFHVSLPVDAAITRLAMSVKGELVEGEVVPRARAREIYDDIVSAQRDPALLEWQSPGEYTLEIFPIEPGEEKHVVLEYTELLPVDEGLASYEFRPLQRQDNTVEHYEVDIVSRSRLTGASPRTTGLLERARNQLTYRASDRESFSVAADVALAAGGVWRSGRYLAADVPIELPPQSPAHRNIVVAIDRSASSNLRVAKRVANQLAAQPHLELRIVHSSTQAARCTPFPGEPRKTVERCFASLERRGATDLSALVRLAATEAAALAGGTDIVLVTDGRVTHGSTRAADVAAAVLDVEHAALHVVGAGDEPRLKWLALLAEHGRGHLIEPAADLPASLQQARTRARIWSATASNAMLDQSWVGAGSRLTAFSASRPEQIVVELRRGDEVSRIPIATAAARTIQGVERLWARWTLRRLEWHAAREEIERFSVTHGVMSRATSYLVLEDAAAFKRHRIRRRKHHARQRAQKRSRPVAIVSSKPIVLGFLDKDLTSRAIRARSGALRGCYEDALHTDPSLLGMLTVEFSVDQGRVSSVHVVSDDMDSGPLADCLLNEFRTLRFPTVKGGGTMTVRYPLHFTSTEPPGISSGPVATSTAIATLLRRASKDEADELLATSIADLGGKTSVDATLRLRLFASQAVRDAYPQEFMQAALTRLRHPTPPRGLLTTVTLRLLERRQMAQLLALPRPPHRVLRWLLGRATHSVSVPELRQLYAHWAQAASPRVRLDAIVGDRVLEVALAGDLVVATLAAQPPADEALDAMARVATVTRWKNQAAAFIVVQCKAEPPTAACLSRLRQLRGIAGVQDALRRQHARRVAQLEEQRRNYPTADVLAELSELLAEIGEHERAVDIAWEIVEHAPHAEAARERAFQLVQSFPPAP